MLLPNPNYSYYKAIYYNNDNTVYGGIIHKNNIWTSSNGVFGKLTNPVYQINTGTPASNDNYYYAITDDNNKFVFNTSTAKYTYYYGTSSDEALYDTSIIFINGSTN